MLKGANVSKDLRPFSKVQRKAKRVCARASPRTRLNEQTPNGQARKRVTIYGSHSIRPYSQEGWPS